MAEKEYIEQAETCKDCLYNEMCDLCADGEICGHFKRNADVVEVVHARWEINCDGYYPYCTNCAYEPPWVSGVDMRTPHCPNCGAKMDGGKDNV